MALLLAQARNGRPSCLCFFGGSEHELNTRDTYVFTTSKISQCWIKYYFIQLKEHEKYILTRRMIRNIY